MRQIISPQLQLGETAIGNIQFNLESRDDIPQILRGLQNIHETPEIREDVFKVLERIVPEKDDATEEHSEKVDTTQGRPGMDLWTIFVLGCLRLNINCDYDRLMELANEHNKLRQILGHGLVDEDDEYCLQTIKDNVSLLTPEVLDEINQIVVKAGHALLGAEDAPLNARCDSVVVETDVDYPTDIGLLLDAMRVIIRECGRAAKDLGLPGWRQFEYNYQCLKRLYRIAQKMKHSTSKDEVKVEAREAKIVEAYQAYLNLAKSLLTRAEETLIELRSIALMVGTCERIEHFIAHAERQIDQTDRRVIQGETIPHEEKVFSVFEEHTEWIKKGKAGVPVELGIRVSVVEDTMGFILHHQVMENQTDDKVAVSIIQETKEKFPNLRLCSFDKGYYTPENREQLQGILDKVVMPKKGRRSKKDQEIETEEEFVSARKRHSAVESAINALEVHGLDRCRDHGIDAFKRYIALAVVARNIQKIGAILLQREKEAAQREERKRKLAA